MCGLSSLEHKFLSLCFAPDLNFIVVTERKIIFLVLLTVTG